MLHLLLTYSENKRRRRNSTDSTSSSMLFLETNAESNPDLAKRLCHSPASLCLCTSFPCINQLDNVHRQQTLSYAVSPKLEQIHSWKRLSFAMSHALAPNTWRTHQSLARIRSGEISFNTPRAARSARPTEPCGLACLPSHSPVSYTQLLARHGKHSGQSLAVRNRIQAQHSTIDCPRQPRVQ